MKAIAGLYVEYCAKDMLDRCQMVDPWSELAYRRICDLIYDTDDKLLNDDRMLAWATKSGRRWPSIKTGLLAGPNPKLLVTDDGRISSFLCQGALGQARQKMRQRAEAGTASGLTGKSLKNLKRPGTDVPILVPPPAATGHGTRPRTNLITFPVSNETGRDGHDPIADIFGRGLRLLTANNVPEKQARPLLGKWRKQFGDAAVLSAIGMAETAITPSDPISFFIGCLNQTKRPVEKSINEAW